jgi:16S rRNA processing protein RimM
VADPGDRVTIARLGRPHGVRGAITAHCDGPTVGTLEVGESVVIDVGGRERPLVIAARRGEAPKAVLAFEGIDTREHAAALTGGRLLVPLARLPEPDDPDTFYVRDLIGFAVREGDILVGTVREIYPGPANDALVVAREGDDDILIPFTHDAVVHVDSVGGVLVLRDGLL